MRTVLMSPPNPPLPSSQDSSAPSSKGTQAHKTGILNQSFGTTWRKAVVSLPRVVPDSLVFKFTSPDGPHPISLKIPSRNKTHPIPVAVFIPPTFAEEATRKTVPSAQSQPHKCPVLLDFHGGGFILGSCQEQAPFCAKMVRSLNCIAISVDYRLGPYAHFPDALHDAEDVLNAILHPFSPGYHDLRNGINAHQTKTQEPRIEIDTTKLALSGFSSGGNLALNLSLNIDAAPGELLLDERWPCPIDPTYPHAIPILLFYPALDTRLLPNERPLPPGMATTAPKGFLANLNLETELMPTYLPKHLTHHPRASPALVNTHPSPSSFINLPSPQYMSKEYKGTIHPTSQFLLILPELDSLTSSNETWLSKMEDERSFPGKHTPPKISPLRIQGVLHGWTQFPDSWLDPSSRTKKREVFEKAVDFLRETWKIT